MRRVAEGWGKPHPYKGFGCGEGELVEEEFEELMNGGEGGRSEEEHRQAASQQKTSGAKVML
jgi:hypothetical protein